MKLRARIVLTLLAITAALAAPAVYGLVRLYDLRAIVRDLRERDTQAADARGRFGTAVEALNRAQAGYSAYAGPSAADDAELLRLARQWEAAAGEAAAQGDSQLVFLRGRAGGAEYRAAVDSSAAAWTRLLEVTAEERRRLREGVPDPANEYREGTVEPAFAATERGLARVARAVEAESRAKVVRAEEVAQSASTTVLVFVALALAVTLALGIWLTRGLLRPIQALREGMAQVAEGDFEPDARGPTARPDEIGDLARSFDTMTERLAELDRLKAEFVSVASHEIKTPLSIIRGYVSLLADGIYGPVGEAQRKTLNAVSDQTDRLARLVHRLLDISRFEAGGGRLELREIDLRAFFDELTGGFQVLATQNGIDFPVTLAPTLPRTLVGDPDRLNEVLGNLLSNAFKFTARGGTIRLDARGAAEDGGVVVEVADTGVGIPPEKLPKIFEKFYQVENDAQPRSVGSGLGLAIAREIVEAHGGTIGADSAVGVGTRFRVTLPGRPPAAKGP